jgi:hypothetical protein
MGYGHLRPAHALARAVGGEVLECDQPPLAGEAERRRWDRTRSLYERLCRIAAAPLGAPFLALLDRITRVPHPARPGALAAPSGETRWLEREIAEGLCAGVVARLRAERAPLVTTFYAPAIAADLAGIDDVLCVVTDVDVNRVWAASDPAASRVRYAVPARRTARRLLAYGVDPARIAVTGFPLPPALLGEGGAAADAALARRLARLDPRGAFAREAPEAARALRAAPPPAAGTAPPHLLLAIGGAGAQRPLALAVVRALAKDVAAGALRVTIATGTRADTLAKVRKRLARDGTTALLGRGLDVLSEPTFPAYEARFVAALADADLLWTKPSELVFFGATGLPLLLAPPLGAQERANRAWALRRGAALDAPRPSAFRTWLAVRRADGSLARAAWLGATRMRRNGTDAVWRAWGSKMSARIPGGPPLPDGYSPPSPDPPGAAPPA